jgi:hypothetical protein
MASDREISSAILQSVQHLFKTDRDGTTVNKVRRMAEEKLGLEDGFLKGSDWKGRSKDIITEEVVCIPLFGTAEMHYHACLA